MGEKWFFKMYLKVFCGVLMACKNNYVKVLGCIIRHTTYSNEFYLTPKEVAKILNCSEITVQRVIEEWRIVCNTQEEYLPTNSLRSIILGARVPTAQLVRFFDLGRENGLKVYKVYPDLEEFKLKKVEISDGN